jgi:site-specific DNA recombinase
VLTVAYCRVSTEEQAEEGFSIEGQANRLRSYAELRELGSVTVIEDPGLSGKDLNRPGLQQVLSMVEAGHVEHVLVWRLDRLSRNLGDLIVLADMMCQREIGLHSFTENLDLSSATGRMFYNILGTFAQFYREQLSENVRMGMHQAVRQGRWINRPPTGYDLVDGLLVPNDDAFRVREVFRLRAAGQSFRAIEDRTGIGYSTVCDILKKRTYMGETLLSGQWFPGNHEALVTEEEFAAAQRGFVKGRRRGRDLLSGRVLCGLCGKRMAVETNGQGRTMYRCHHRGKGCAQPRRTNVGLHRAALLGMELLAHDRQLQEAIRRQLAGTRCPDGRASGHRRRDRRTAAERLGVLADKRRKLLDLYYREMISAEGFAEEERRLADQMESVRSEDDVERASESAQDDLSERFEAVVTLLRSVDLSTLWAAADESERRVLVDELVESVTVWHDHLSVVVSGAPSLNVTLEEVGLKSQIVGVGGGKQTISPPPIWVTEVAA